MKCFIYNNDLYIRAIPGKNLFKSTMVHDVVNRGDIFAVRVRDQCLTIIPGTATVEHVDRIAGKLEDFRPQVELFPERIIRTTEYLGGA